MARRDLGPRVTQPGFFPHHPGGHSSDPRPVLGQFPCAFPPLPWRNRGKRRVLALFQPPTHTPRPPAVGVASQEDKCFTKWQMHVLSPGSGRRWVLGRKCQLAGQRELQPHLRYLNSHRLLWAPAGGEASGQRWVGEQGSEQPTRNLSQPHDECRASPPRGTWTTHPVSRGLKSHHLRRGAWKACLEGAC